ncbi:MAG: tetratricopeptide repeat protein [Candidatus Kapaibacterium sp.]
MTNDDLLLKYFDGTLSENERADFDNRVKSSPEFADEVRSIATLEDALAARKIPITDDTERFLATVGISATSAIPPPPMSAPTGTAGSSSSGAGASGILGSKLVMGIMGAVIGGGIVVGSIIYSNSNSDNNPQPVQPVVRQTPTADSSTASLPPRVETPRPQPQVVQQPPVATDTHKVEISPKASPNLKEPVTPPAAEAPAKLKAHNSSDGLGESKSQIKGSDNYAAQITKSNAEYAKAVATGNKIDQAIAAKQLGILYRDIDGKQNDARSWLEKSISLAHDANVAEVEAQAHGELGLLEKKLGNRDKAIDQLQKCIDLMRSGNIQGVEKWAKALEDLRNH